MKTFSNIFGKILLGMVFVAGFSACEDFFEVESTHTIDADKDHLTTATDTIYSMIGVLNKVQAIGDRTILLGEMRGDLTTVTSQTSSDLRDVSRFEVGDDNVYNQPRDYYAIINNCNYFIAHADTAMKNNRNEKIFLKEYAAIKAIRAWTYLQLVTTYGRVPFVLDPILSDAEARQDFPQYGIEEVCNYFIDQDGLQELVDVEMPMYGDIRQLSSKLFYFPVRVVLGDLCLWANRYWEAATFYHDYIVNRNGKNTAYAIGTSAAVWSKNTWEPESYVSTSSYRYLFSQEYSNASSELITIIPTDSLPSEGNYSQLRNIFNSRAENDYAVSAKPSQALYDLSAAQDYWYYDSRTQTYSQAPKNLDYHADGDLRLYASVYQKDNVVIGGDSRSYYQIMYKYSTRNIHIYRRGQIYLRLAEAANRAGYPMYAYKILSTGLDNDVLQEEVCPVYAADSAKLVSNLGFPISNYQAYDPTSLSQSRMNTIGVHMRGCGYTVADTLYCLPQNPAITNESEHLNWQMEQVENMIVDEMALECAFEGTRFYDLMRVSLHRNDPSFLANKVQKRNGTNADPGVAVDLTNKANWFLHWKDQIGY